MLEGIVSLIDFSQLQNFTTLFLSIVIESLPFVILGVLVAALISVFVSPTLMLRLIPKNNIVAHGVVALLGVTLPVCQCGNVPVARRLIAQGLKPSLAVTFLLAAPIVNPITFLTTWEAFGRNHEIAAIRLVAGFIIAVTIGLLLHREKNQQLVLTDKFEAECHLDHRPERSLTHAVEIFQTEFILLAKFLVFGAAVAALIQTFIPKEVILSISQDPITAVLAPMILAFILSLCSTFDAFFALSLTGTFMIGSVLSFLIFGPLINVKMLALLRPTFKPSFLVYLSVLIGLATLLIGFVGNSLLGYIK